MATATPTRSSADSTRPPQSQDNRPPESLPTRTFPLGRVLAAVTVNWLIPGTGYFLVGEKWRAWALVVLLNGMFLLGLGLQGAVILPEFNVRSQTFNVINVLTFVVQMGSGGPSGLSLVAHRAREAGAPEVMTRFWAGEESAATYDLGAFHLLLVGALNYFACCAIYDRHRQRPQPAGKSGPG